MNNFKILKTKMIKGGSEHHKKYGHKKGKGGH